MKDITVSIDEETYRLSRIMAAEIGTSVSALVRSYLRSLVQEKACEAGADGQEAETERQRRRRMLDKVVESIHSRGGRVRMPEILPRETIHDRDALR